MPSKNSQILNLWILHSQSYAHSSEFPLTIKKDFLALQGPGEGN